MSIAAKDGNGAALTLASVTTPLGEAPGSTPVDPADGLPFKASSEATLEAARLLISGLLTNSQLRASNLGVQLAALLYPESTLNNSTTPLAAGASFTGGIETVQQLQAAQVQVYCDQPYSVTINQYIDLAGTKRSASDTLYRAAGQPLSINVTLPGNYFNLVVTNLGIEPTEAFELNTTFGIMDSGPRRLGRASENDSMPVTFSNEDADMMNDMLQRLGVLNTARNSDGSLRVTLLGGTVATITTVGTVTTVTTVGTVSNQTNMGGYTAAPQIPALMNLAAASNIDRMVG